MYTLWYSMFRWQYYTIEWTFREEENQETSIDHYGNVSKIAAFSFQVTEKLPWNGYENGIKDNAMLDYRFQRVDYWMKIMA